MAEQHPVREALRYGDWARFDLRAMRQAVVVAERLKGTEHERHYRQLAEGDAKRAYRWAMMAAHWARMVL